MPADRPLLSFAAAAVLTGYAESTLRRWHHAGDLPAGMVLRLNGRWYVRRAALLAWRDALADASGQQPDALRLVKASER